MRLIKKVFFGFFLMFSILIIWINLKLYDDNFNTQQKESDIILQLNFLNTELKNNDLGKRMQKLFPEGFVFTNVLYGLSWCELGISNPKKKTRERALSEALYSYNQINTTDTKSTFSSTVKPKNGIFYLGWNNYLLSKILVLDSNFENCETYKTIYKNQCELIVETLQNSNSPFLQSYENQSWPADMCVAMASVSNYEKIFNEKYKNTISDWVIKVKSKLDPKTKLIPHKVNSYNGETIEGARGCSISLILRLLSEIDLKFAREQYNVYQQNFVSTTFGLPSINEYPIGQSGFGDIDSGPVIFGVGFAGTIVSIGTFSVLGDNDLAENQYKTVNSFGMSYGSSNTKKYLFGQFPIADAFIAWSRSSGLYQTKNLNPSSNHWRFKFHLISIFTIAFFWFLFYSKTLYKKLKKMKNTSNQSKKQKFRNDF
jgi:hypothetical protein